MANRFSMISSRFYLFGLPIQQSILASSYLFWPLLLPRPPRGGAKRRAFGYMERSFQLVSSLSVAAGRLPPPECPLASQKGTLGLFEAFWDWPGKSGEIPANGPHVARVGDRLQPREE